jgi:hypothetical protein
MWLSSTRPTLVVLATRARGFLLLVVSWGEPPSQAVRYSSGHDPPLVGLMSRPDMPVDLVEEPFDQITSAPRSCYSTLRPAIGSGQEASRCQSHTDLPAQRR